MSRKAHNRVILTVCLFLTLAAFALTFAQISQGYSLTDSDSGCPQGSITSIFSDGSNGVCKEASAPFESASLLLFGLGLVGFAHAIRRSFGDPT
ncbi:MAG TPA: hypothetical protein PKE66_09600 [Pyrinomonadaceae bacterium]|nr:hypothetical protein [Pyrinomonadaceae bacterium]